MQNGRSEDYRPDVFEYDEELEDGQQDEKVILDPDTNEPHQVVRTIGRRKMDFQKNLVDFDEDQLIQDFLNENKKQVICEYFVRGNCKYGDACDYMHPSGSYTGNFANSMEERAYIEENDEECQICLERVLASGKQFGILDGCDHTFCLKCIREWRATFDKRTSKHHFRTCPICRQNSFLVIPSYYMVMSGPEKDELIEEYNSALKEIPCKHFNFGKGQCPFLNSCKYEHRLKNGQLYEYPWQDNMKYSDGRWQEDIETTLADRIGFI